MLKVKVIVPGCLTTRLLLVSRSLIALGAGQCRRVFYCLFALRIYGLGLFIVIVVVYEEVLLARRVRI